MTRFLAPSGIRHALKVGLAAVTLAGGATWLMAGDTPAGRADGRLQVAQAAPPAAPGASAFDTSQKAAIESILRDYLIKNPEIMLEIQAALDAKMEKLQQDKLKLALTTHGAEIYHSKNAPVAGNPTGDVPVVEFFDYNCGYCKRAFSDISKLVDGDGKIRLVLKEYPILSKGSEEASRVALAARMQGKYWPVHQALIVLRGEVNGQTALRAVEKLTIGLDMAKLKADMASEEVTAEINRVKMLAKTMGIQGTPHFLVGDHVIPGAPTDLLQQIQSHVAEVRKTGCAVC